MQNAHHSDDILSKGGRGIDLGGIVDEMEAYGSKGQILQQSLASCGIIDWYKFLILDDLIVYASGMTIDHANEHQNSQYSLHLNNITMISV